MTLHLAIRSRRLGFQSRSLPSQWTCYASRQQFRNYASHKLARLSNYLVPTGGIAQSKSEDAPEGAHALLVRAGFIRQSHAGLFQFLPLGLRVQQKIEKLIDKHMQALGASKLSLSTLSSEELWKQSGRLQGDRSELFQLIDRKGAKYLLSPTHEEEITSLVASLAHSHRDLPLKLYQMSRKYRDEARPRAGLLRSREFLMKDLYTFDMTRGKALDSYYAVRRAYANIFADLNLPIFSAVASSGSIGGDLSHEYHLPSPVGEDDVLVCSECKWAGNTEIFEMPDPAVDASTEASNTESSNNLSEQTCPSCQSHSLKNVKAIELGHTFHLGTKYSAPLELVIANPSSSTPNTPQPVEMGCHGIGISRLVAGAAAHLSDAKGLNWPARIAPFEVVVVPSKDKLLAEAEGLAALLSMPTMEETSKRMENNEADTRFSEIQVLEERKVLWELGQIEENSEVDSARVPESTGADTKYDALHSAKLSDAAKHSLLQRMAEKHKREADLASNLQSLLGNGEQVVSDEKNTDGKDEHLTNTQSYKSLRTTSKEGLDVVLDDRGKDFIWKLCDAELVGYPIIVVLGRAWKKERKVEVQCRRRNIKTEVNVSEVRSLIESLLTDL